MLTRWNDGWSFCQTCLDVSFEEVQTKRGDFQAVSLPHEWQIWHAKRLEEDGLGWYLKTFYISNPQTLFRELRFDGV
jgi:hypothetical protein